MRGTDSRGKDMTHDRHKCLVLCINKLSLTNSESMTGDMPSMNTFSQQSSKTPIIRSKDIIEESIYNRV